MTSRQPRSTHSVASSLATGFAIAMVTLGCSDPRDRTQPLTLTEAERANPAINDKSSPPSVYALPVILDRAGVVAIGSKRILFDDVVLDAFRTFHERVPHGTIVIHANRATLHGRLVRIVELVNRSGSALAIQIEHETDSPED